MSDAWTVLLAAATFAGALAGVDGHLWPVPLVVATAAVGAALALRRPALLCGSAALLAAVLGQRSVAGLAPPQPGPVQGEVTLVSDPEPDGRGGVVVDTRLAGRRLRAVARGAAAAALDDRLMGERVMVLGSIEAPGPYERLLRHRHLAGRLRVETVVAWAPGDPATRAANGVRRTLARGAEALSPRQRSLLAGLTLGDDRDQPPDLRDAFQAAGLTHLLAVSGQNVAFVLLMARPALTRLRFGPRLVAGAVILSGFALLTRFEPSVLRATAMAFVATVGATLGRPASTVRALALGTTGLVLVDPLLVTSLGFQLSLAATAGIVAGAARLARVLPGPAWLAAPLSVTLAAQLAVSPLLVVTFGGVPLASLPANLLAAPAAGPVMVWGLTAGLAAGVLPAPAAAALHLPTRAALTWIEGVAIAASRWPLGELGARHLALVGVGAAGLAAGAALGRRPAATGGARRRPGVGDAGAPVSEPGAAPGGEGPPRGVTQPRLRVGRGGVPLRWAGAALILAACLSATAGRARATGHGRTDLGVGVRAWWSDTGAILVIDGRARAEHVLARLRERGVERIDAVVLRTDARSAGEAAAALRRRWPGVLVLAPPAHAHRGTGAVHPPPGAVIVVGDLRLTVVAATRDELQVDVELIQRE